MRVGDVENIKDIYLLGIVSRRLIPVKEVTNRPEIKSEFQVGCQSFV